MRVAIYQSNIIWEADQQNCENIEKLLKEISLECDMLILPEMFNSGFTMSPESVAQRMDGHCVEFLKRCAKEYNTAIMGSLIIEEGGDYYNRLIFATPDKPIQYYDKRHLFRMSGEHKHFKGGDKRPIFEYMGLRILPQVCYDLRFPVWSRNVGLEYDLAIYVASWPEARVAVWETLLVARALENQCYVVGVNRVGSDPSTSYNGKSAIIDFLGKQRISLDAGEEGWRIFTLDIEKLRTFRDKFPAYLDADDFTLNP